jgi:hypothetical protein
MSKRTPVQAGLNALDAQRIQAAANKTNQTIWLVGSRATGTAGPNSDWDYIMNGNAKQRNSAKSSLPGWTSAAIAAQNGLGHGVTTTGRGIDVFQNYSEFDSMGCYCALDMTRAYVEFAPAVVAMNGPLGQVSAGFAASHHIGNPNTGLQYINARSGANGSEAFDIPK